MAARKLIDVKIVSDTICPWCWVGKKHFEKAVDAVKEKFDFKVQWLPFQLNPSTPPDGLDKEEHLAKKVGCSIADVRKMHARLAAAGEKVGVRFAPGGRVVNTVRSHRLNDWAYHKGGAALQDRVVEESFRRYFDLQEDVNNVEVLADIAASAGLDRAEARQFLESEELLEEVVTESSKWSGQVDGVPFFIFNNKFALSGAQPPQAFLQAFERAGAM